MRISQSSILRWGDRRGSSPFRGRSRNQQVPCESLDTFFSQERNCQCGRHEPTKAKTFLKFWFEAECILPPAPNGSLHKTKISLWAYAAHSRASLKLDTISRFGLRKNDKLSTRQSLQLPLSPSFTTKFSNFTGVPRGGKGREFPCIGTGKILRQNQTEIKVSDSNFLLCQDD